MPANPNLPCRLKGCREKFNELSRAKLIKQQPGVGKLQPTAAGLVELGRRARGHSCNALPKILPIVPQLWVMASNRSQPHLARLCMVLLLSPFQPMRPDSNRVARQF